jgi:hypothetical protein
MAASIVSTLINLKGGEVARDDMLCYSYPDAPIVETVADDDITVNVFKQWVAVTKKETS